MKNPRINILALTTVIILSSCSVIHQPVVPPRSQVTQSQQPTPPQPSPRGTSEEIVIDNIEFVSPSLPEIRTPEKRETPIPTYDFTRLELEHVKFSNHDPFPTNGNIYRLNLDEASSQFTFPLNKSRFSSGYGKRGRGFHSGIDLLEEADAPIYAAFDGVVRISKPYYNYGNIIVLRHSNGLETVYSHNSKNLVEPGEYVHSGQQIATVGRTGRATANHLHFEVRVLGQTFDPRLLIDLDNKTLHEGYLEVHRDGDKLIASNPRSGFDNELQPTQPKPEEVATAAPPRPSNRASSNSTNSQYHTIVKGDTLYGISRKYKTSVSNLCKLNNITERTTLALGRKLRVR